VQVSLRQPGQFTSPDGNGITSTCLNCPDQPCIQFTDTEMGYAARLRQPDVCPVSAISFSSRNTKLHVTDDCIHCGLCVARCPYGCLFLDDSLTPRMNDPAAGGFAEANETEFEAFDEQLKRAGTLSKAERERTVGQVLPKLRDLEQMQFYPLVANLLTAIGLPSILVRKGDTSNRMDVLIPHTRDSIPVEIKSPAESEAANIKSVQQALENKVVLQSRHEESFPTSADTTSLVVAFTYPSERSDVLELTTDINKAYGVRIGLIDAEALLQLALDLPGDAELKEIAHLLGPL